MKNLVFNYFSSPLKAQSFMDHSSDKKMFEKINYRIKLYQITQILNICKASQRMKLPLNLTCPPVFLSSASIPGREIYNIFMLSNKNCRLPHVQNDLPSEVTFPTHSHTHRDVAVSGPRFWWPHLMSCLQGGERLLTTGSSFISNSWPLNLINSSLYIRSTNSKLRKSVPMCLLWNGKGTVWN